MTRLLPSENPGADAVDHALRDGHFAALQRLADAAERGADAAHGHPQRVGVTVVRIAGRLGLGPFQAAWLGHAAPLHDIGKLAVPDALLDKPSRLTDAEFEIVKFHAEAGATMLSGSGSRLLAVAAEIAFAHHERFDGGGYPRGLAGEAIPLSGRITALADVFDALTHARPYKEAWSIDRALAEIQRLRGAHFDPAVVDAFLEGLGEADLARPKLVAA